MTEAWEWDEPTWRGMVEQVRAGRSLLPASWPGGKRCAVALSFDSDHETNELRDGGESVARLSWGEYGARRGIPRIRQVLDRYDARATFFVPAVSALLHPEEQRELADQGHEIGLHGWIHERNTQVPPEVERDLMLRASDTLERICGTRPVGMRTPSWDYSKATLAIAREMGLLYDSSLFSDDDPYEILDRGEPTGMVELPVEWIRDDAAYFMMNRFGAQRPYTPPADVLDIFLREFEGARAEGGLFLLTMHPHITGYRSRIFILERLLDHITAAGDCWIASHADIARYCAETAGLKGTS
ncbi:MAG TPA: polysaccharide deacetylase [Citreicella sp.]|jgi:peptidoglycan-N-acetylglucosamine deacetylase|uniref:Chitooligosaccharide deacetylase n=1 Tax=Salipiger marinus TaxID=555512 RepID=A0A1G8RU98_9RHOB|nr:polysaccharide deacetylase [Salipiger marinus]SDJ19910.1 Peptidoglycan/xylan/chitin deacetylase, PgdA/CDA1 family [Salipiger marinus]HBM61853.1 polysaccharide deacetylase [Citreicella sp.]HBT00597.1 polysaccharide deacetylase [Citreicella sp.]|tara:strand:+ start:376 stop:1275 length:900 start_codon:yes stop_codon:yes gene_type:complete